MSQSGLQSPFQVGMLLPPTPMQSNSVNAPASSRSHSGETSTSSSVKAMISLVLFATPVFRAREDPWPGSNIYRTLRPEVRANSSTTPRVLSVELLSTTPSFHLILGGNLICIRLSIDFLNIVTRL